MQEKKTSKFKKFQSLSLGVKIFLIAFFLFFLVEAFLHIYPFLWVINSSLKSGAEIRDGNALAITKSWQFSNFVDVFKEFTVEGSVNYWGLFINSTWQTGMYLFINIFSSTLLAYALAKFHFPGRGLLYGLMIFTQTIPLIGSGVIDYRLKFDLGLVNNPALIWISWAMGFDFSAFIMFGTFQGVSNSYMEAATIDGANDFQIFGRVVFPQAFPCIVALLCTNFCTMWNNYGVSQITLNEYPNLAYGLFRFEQDTKYMAEEGIYYAAMILTSLPGIIFYAVTQNGILKNISVGGLKG